MLIIHERIKHLRKEKNITQKSLAEIIGVKEVSFQRYEYDMARPSLEKLVVIADYFDVSMDYLIGRSDNPKRT